MKFRSSMKRKNIIIAIILVIVSASFYIWTSTTYINDMNYRKRAYDIGNNAKDILDWENAKVTLVKLDKEPCSTPQILTAKINRNLLLLNGGYAVKVEMHTEMDGLLGPYIVYFNPFTKQCIGGVLRM